VGGREFGLVWFVCVKPDHLCVLCSPVHRPTHSTPDPPVSLPPYAVSQGCKMRFIFLTICNELREVLFSHKSAMPLFKYGQESAFEKEQSGEIAYSELSAFIRRK
jgi:hypothetical protein